MRSGMTIGSLVEQVDVVTLLVWWAVWTAADRLLIRYSPASECAALLCAALLHFAKQQRARCARSCTTVICEVTQTPEAPPSVNPKGARSYARQGEEV